MLTVVQQDLLNDLIGPEGCFMDNVINSSSFSSGCKIMYLQRAIKLNCHQFLNTLDTLYDDSKPETLDMIRSLKLINDLCFNHQIQVNSILKSALDHCFAQISQDVVPALFQQAIIEIIGKSIDKLTTSVATEDLKNQIAQQIFSESRFFIPDNSWRQQEKLPNDQKHRKEMKEGYPIAAIANLSPRKREQLLEPAMQKLIYFNVLSGEEWLNLNPIQFEMLTDCFINKLLHLKNISLKERLEVETKEQIQNIMDIYQTLPEYVDCSFTEILAFNRMQCMAVEQVSTYIALGLVNQPLRELINLDQNQIENLRLPQIQFLIFSQVLSFQEGLHLSHHQRQKIISGKSSAVVREIKYPVSISSCCLMN